MQSTKTISQIEEKLQQLRSQLETQQSSPQPASPIILQALESAISKLEVQLAAAPTPDPISTETDPSEVPPAASPKKPPRHTRLLPGNGQHRASAKLYGYLSSEVEDRVCLKLVDGTMISCRVYGKHRKNKLTDLQTDRLYKCLIYPTIREGRLVNARLHRWALREEPQPEAWLMTGVFALKTGCPPAVLVQRDAQYLKQFGRNQQMRIYPQHVGGLEDLEIEPRKCYEFPIRREGERIVLAGTPTRIEVGKPSKDSAVKVDACPEAESAA